MGRAHEVRKVAMAKTAAKKAKVYSRYGKEIYLAAKAGGPEPDANLSLRRLKQKRSKSLLMLLNELSIKSRVVLLKIMNQYNLKVLVLTTQQLSSNV